jgi:hypothetical protein
MAVTITVDGTPGNALSVPIGVALALSEQAGFVGASVVQWALTRPPLSAAALTVAGSIGAPPWTNAFTPDVPGDYRVRVVVTYPNGSTAEDSVVVAVALPQVTGAQILPAPSESTEREADTGWADGVATGLKLALDMQGPAEWIVILNDTGGTLTGGSVIWVGEMRRWPDITGGTPVPGAPLDYVVVGSIIGTPPGIPVVVLESIADGARGRALRRGIAVLDTTAIVPPSVGSRIYSNGLGGITTHPNHWPIGFSGYGTATALQAGWLLFDPTVLLGNQAATAPLPDSTLSPIPVDASRLAFPVALVHGFSLRYCITRGSLTQVGRLMIATDGASTSLIESKTALSSPGVTFSASVTAGIVALGFITTATGTAARMDFAIEEVWRA